MRLTQRTTLVYQEGTSDKVYEVDLCAVGGDRYVVNFRYGRRGGNLKEGVKTVSPVPEAEARATFDRLVQSKVKKGYRDAAESSSAPAPAAASPSQPSNERTTTEARETAILDRIAGMRRDEYWSVDRAIWRAGELRIADATAMLVQLVGTREDEKRDYTIAWALGRIGRPEAIAPLTQLYRDARTPDSVRRMALAALLQIADEPTKMAICLELSDQLPAPVRSAVRSRVAERVTETLNAHLEGDARDRFAVLDTLYHLTSDPAIAPCVRPGLLDVLRSAPLKPGYFQRFRHIFKLAEFHLDSEVFGILAYRFDTESENFSSQARRLQLEDGAWLSNYRTYNRRTGRYERVSTPVQTELQQPNSRLAYSSKTRAYIRRRVWRTLRRLGQDDDPAYTSLATGVLLTFSDEDAEPILETTFFRYDPRRGWGRNGVSRWDAFAGYLSLNSILYTNSPRYSYKTSGKAWRCQDDYTPGDPAPADREEAFPHLWERDPAALLRLMLESRCRIVHEFAVKAFRACRAAWDDVSLADTIALLESPYEITAQFASELAIARYQPDHPDMDLVLAMANCQFAEARAIARRWIEAQRDRFARERSLVVGVMFSHHADTRQFARGWLSATTWEDNAARALVGQIVAGLLAIEMPVLEESEAEPKPEEETSPEREKYEAELAAVSALARDAGETLLASFGAQVRSLGLGVVLDVLQHPLAAVQEVGARILLDHETPAENLPSGLISALLESPYDAVRSIGVRIFGQLPDEILTRREEVLLTIAAHESEAMRQEIRPILQRLERSQPDFCLRFADTLIGLMLAPEDHEGVHRDIALMLGEDLQGWREEATPELARQLLAAKASAARELAGLVLTQHATAWAESYSVAQLVRMANREVLTVREAARNMFEQVLPSTRQNESALVMGTKLLESRWSDTREYGMELFATRLALEELTPSVLISICDSNKADVRKFGRDRVVQSCFQEANGQEYLLKFSEHPATDMQLFATNYLAGYAADRPDRLEILAPYFTRVLSQVNRGRVAKQRIVAFLQAEADKNEASARIVAEILTRQSATIAIGDKARAIQTMLAIRGSYADIDLPIQVREMETRSPETREQRAARMKVKREAAQVKAAARAREAEAEARAAAQARIAEDLGVTIAPPPTPPQAVGVASDASFDPSRLRCVQTIALPNADICSVEAIALNRDATRIASSYETNRSPLFVIWERASGNVQEFTAAGDTIRDIVMAPDGGTQAIAGGHDGQLIEWQLGGSSQPVLQANAPISALATSPTWKQAIFVGGNDGIIRVFDSSWQLVHSYKAHRGSISKMLASADGRYLVTGGNDRTVKVWHLPSYRVVQSWIHPKGWVTSLAMTPNGRYIFAGGQYSIAIWDAQTGTAVETIQAPNSFVRALALSPDNNTLFSAGVARSGAIAIWDWQAGRQLGTLGSHEGNINALEMSADGRFLVSGGNDIKVWGMA
ncbi:MAG: HEAT repeat domain-containing protein [Cyanobacteria bacterium J06639_1]